MGVDLVGSGVDLVGVDLVGGHRSKSRNTINVSVQMLVKTRITTCIPYKSCAQLIINSVVLEMFATEQIVVANSGVCILSTLREQVRN